MRLALKNEKNEIVTEWHILNVCEWDEKDMPFQIEKVFDWSCNGLDLILLEKEYE